MDRDGSSTFFTRFARTFWPRTVWWSMPTITKIHTPQPIESRPPMNTLYLEIQEQILAYWHDVDRNWGRNAHEFYTADGRYTTSQKSRQGRDEIRAFYSDREARGERVARHLVSNLHVVSRS